MFFLLVNVLDALVFGEANNKETSFLASNCPINFPSRVIKPKSFFPFPFVGMTLAIASFKLPTRKSWKNANAHPIFTGVTFPSMNFAEEEL